MKKKNIKSYLKNFICIDAEREKRNNIPEFIFAENKSSAMVEELLYSIAESNGWSAATRVSSSVADYLAGRFKSSSFKFRWEKEARVFVVYKKSFSFKKKYPCPVGIISAGSSDIYIAEEARVVCSLLGCQTVTYYDVGVAGLHRLAEPLDVMLKKNVCAVIVVAGMDGVLPTIVKSLMPLPVIGVPSSCGYGWRGRGEAALNTMLQSCSPGLLVVNIDNGFGAAVAAVLIAKSASREYNSGRRKR